MLARVFSLMTFLAVLLPQYDDLLAAQSRTDMVCWGEEKCRYLCGREYDQYLDCGAGGHSGFSPDYACQQTCGTNRGPKCKVILGVAGECGACGFRAVRVECYN